MPNFLRSSFHSFFVKVGDLLAVHVDLSPVVVEEADDAFDEHALAGAASPDDHHGLAALDFQVHPAQDMVFAEGLVRSLELRSSFADSEQLLAGFPRNHVF